MTESSFSFQEEPWTLLLSLAAIIAVCVLAWISWQQSGYRRSIGVLEALRVALVCLAAFLLNQPERVKQFVPSQKPTVVVLGDQSLSMTTRDVGIDGNDQVLQTREEMIKPLMDEATWASLKEDLNVVVVPFAGGDDNARSDLYDALSSARDEHPNLRAVVLASDGDWNSGSPPVEMATRLRLQQIPIFGVPVGASTRLPDIDLLSFDAPSNGVVGQEGSNPVHDRKRDAARPCGGGNAGSIRWQYRVERSTHFRDGTHERRVDVDARERRRLHVDLEGPSARARIKSRQQHENDTDQD